MEFKKFNSIENSYRTKFMNQLVQQGKANGVWIAQEKVHGANMSFYFNGRTYRAAKRTQFIDDPAEFYNCESIIAEMEPKIRALYEEIKKDNKNNVDEIVVYGELFGGNYPHPDVPNTDFSSVQKGVFYSPVHHFYGFDIRIDGEYGDVKYINEKFEKHGIMYAQTLVEGTLDECLAYPKEFNSTIPGLLGLPDIGENIGEGTVVRPNKTKYLFSDSRIIIKNKSAKFSEKEKVPKVPKAPVVLTPEAEKLLGEASSYITENRLRNVLSKIGSVNDKEFGKIMGLLNKDAIEDFMKDSGEEFTALDKKERKIITKEMGKLGADLLRPNFLNIIDGEF